MRYYIDTTTVCFFCRHSSNLCLSTRYKNEETIMCINCKNIITIQFLTVTDGMVEISKTTYTFLKEIL